MADITYVLLRPSIGVQGSRGFQRIEGTKHAERRWLLRALLDAIY